VRVSNVVETQDGRLAVAGPTSGAVDFSCVPPSQPSQVIYDNEETIFFALYGSGGDLDGLWRIGDGWEGLYNGPDVSLASSGDGAFLLGGRFKGNPVIDGIGDDSYVLHEEDTEGETNGFLIRACP
jgi:hypothetical protein